MGFDEVVEEEDGIDRESAKWWRLSPLLYIHTHTHTHTHIYIYIIWGLAFYSSWGRVDWSGPPPPSIYTLNGCTVSPWSMITQ